MKSVFLYGSPHLVNESWARSIDSLFIEDKAGGIANISRFLKSFHTLMKIPRDTDLVLCEGGSQIFSGALWKLFNKNKRVSLIVSEPKFYHIHRMNFFKKNFYYWCLSKYDLFICTTPFIRSLLPRVKGKKVIVNVYADVKRFSKVKGNLDKNICYAGRLSKDKGADLTIKTFKLLRDRFPRSKLFLFGHGLTNDIKKLIDKNIKLMGRVNNLENYYKDCSIYLSLARIDAANISVIEAMCSGLVPIVSKNVGNKFIVEKVSKKLVVNNEKEAAKIIEKLWNNKKMLKKVSDRCREVGKKYDKEYSVNQFNLAIEDKASQSA